MPTLTAPRSVQGATVKGHLVSNSATPLKTSSRHAITGLDLNVSRSLGGSQPNTDRRRYVTHK